MSAPPGRRIPIQVLLVEDMENDALLVVNELRRAGFEASSERVETAAAMQTALARQAWDLIIADYSLPRFSGLAALALAKRESPGIPVIVVSGAIGEETAVEAMRAGARDYVMKDNLARLGPAVRRELAEAEDRRARARVERELERTSEALSEAQRGLIQSEKLAALGQLSSGVAHEVKNPLGIILGGVELLDVTLRGGDRKVRTAVEKIREAALRAAGIVDEMLTFSRPSDPAFERVDPDALVRQVLSLFRYSVRSRHVRLHAEYARDPALALRADANQLQQVLLNLLTNGAEAMEGGGEIRVSVVRVPAADSPLGQPSCSIRVADTGVGIREDQMAHLFEPFFTTKRDRKGTGLGLPVAKTIIERHGGRLAIVSREGSGTVALITLPLADPEPEKGIP